VKRFFLAIISTYQRQISPRSTPRCRFIPTCSHYAHLAISRYGAFHGGVMAVSRIIRCHPFSKGGYDPVPEDLYIVLRKD